MKRAFGLQIPQTLQEIVQPDRCALIIYDMQVGIVPQIASGQEIQARCVALVEAARKTGMRIFYMRHFFLPSAAAGRAQLRRAMVWQGEEEPQNTKCFIPYGSSGFQLVPELQPQDGEVIIDKMTMSAFEGTFLNIALRDAGIDAFLIAGIALEIGIEPTVRQSLDLNYIPVVIADACGSKSEELRLRSLATLEETGEVLTVTTSKIVSILATP